MVTEIRVGSELIKTFTDLIIAQNFNAHHEFSFYIPNDRVDSGAFFINEGVFTYIGKEIAIKWGADKSSMSCVFNGIVTGTNIVTRDKDAANLYVTGYSSSYAFSNLPKTRSFFDKDPKSQKQTLEDVIKEVVKDAKVDPYCSLSCNLNSNIKLPYVVQYKENIFDFLKRLAVRYGEWLYVDEKTLHFGNAKKMKTHELLLGLDLFDLDYGLSTQPVQLGAMGYNHQLGDKFTEGGDAKSMGDVLDKLYKAQKNIFGSAATAYLPWQPNSPEEVKKQAEYHYQEQMADMLRIRGTCNKIGIKLGDVLKFKIRNYSKNDVQENFNEYRVVSIIHHMDGTDTEVYSSKFKAIDKNLTYLPVDLISMPSPYDAQPEYAEVIATKDPSARIQVSFFWNKEGGEHNKSFYMPCLSSYAGGKKEPSNRGILFIPEIGDTVLVGYYQHDPNHPYVMGALHNSKTAKIKDEYQEKNEIKSITTAGGHVIEFNDKVGAESITLTDKDKNSILMNKDGMKIVDMNKNSIEMTKEGIQITAEKNIKITAKELTISADTIKLDASKEIEQKAGSSSIKIGTEIQQKAGASQVTLGAASVAIQSLSVNIG